MELKLLFIEDDETLGKNLKKIFDGETILEYQIKADTISIFEEGIDSIKNKDYDIVVLDLYKDKDAKDEEAGIKVLNQIRETAFIPIIFYTGHAHKITDLISEVVGVVSKGEIEGGIVALKREIARIITSKIALLKGQIYNHLRESLRQYFWETVHAEKRVFEPIKNDISLGYLLLRRFANSLSKENIKQLLGDDKIKADKAHPMEFYIYPTSKGEYESGEILLKGGIFYIILTPTCDFIEDKEAKRERRVGKVLLAVATALSETDYYKDYKQTSNDKNKERLARVIETRKGDQFFFLPGTPFIENLVLDFQNKIMVEYNDLKAYTRIAKLDDPYAQSMVSSFIRYYNRIGFPDIDAEYVIASYPLHQPLIVTLKLPAHLCIYGKRKDKPGNTNAATYRCL
jgi:CheY-like chemotaxis protein